MQKKITTLFTDIGGVLLTNGWDRHARGEASVLFNLDSVDLEERHHLTFDTYEVGKLTLDEYLERITFKLNEFVDFFVSSSFVHFRKPDADIFKVAIDISQSDVETSLYIDDRMLFVQVAEGLGLRGIHHTDYEDTKAQLAAYGLEV
jgi:putative hydrolase of the HAD superfamily